jgi:subtilisin family serine protease
MNKLIVGSFLAVVLLPFSVNAASINSIDPQYITPGETEVTIYGNGFGDSSLYKYLYFGSTPAYASSWSDSSITVKVPYSLYSSGNIEISGSFKMGQTCYGTYCYDKTEYMRVVGPKYYLLPQIVQTTDEIYNGATFEIAGKYFGVTQGSVTLSGDNCRVVIWQSNYIKCQVPEIYNQSGSVSYSIRVPESNNYQVSGSVSYLKSISNDSHSYLQNYLTSSGITKVWDKYTGKGVVVAVIDGGVDINNYDLKESLWRNNGEIRNNNIDDDGNGFIDDYYGYNFIDRDANLFPSNSHGTAVAGIIAAKKNNGWGLAGIAPDAKIMNLKVCSSRGCVVQDVIDAIIYAADNGADIINLSLGGDGSLGYTPNYDDAIEYAYNKNVLIVAAAGNGDTAGAGTRGQDISSVKASPVSNDGDKNYVLGVGATDGKNNATQWTNYSQDYVDVSAPGEDVPVLSVPVYNSGYDIDEMDGTSFSAPIVAGVAALLKEKNPQWRNYELMSQIISQSDKFSNGYNVYGNILNAKNILDNSYPNTELTSVYPTVFGGSGKLIIYGKNFHRDVKIHISNSNRSGDIQLLL